MTDNVTRVRQDLTYYNDALAGKRPTTFADEPQAGYYRYRNDAVMIKARASGTMAGFINNSTQPVTGDDLNEIWMACARHPIQHSVWVARLQEGRWPEQQAAVEATDDLAADLHAYAQKYASFMKDAKLETQAQADIMAGYVQQGRALLKSGAETFKAIKAPIEQLMADAKKAFGKPLDEIDALNKDALKRLAEMGTEMKRKSNDPDFKFAAGKAGEGKTIGLRRNERLIVTNEAEVLAKFGDSDAIKEAIKDLTIRMATAAASEHHKKTGEVPAGMKLDTYYTAA